MKPNLPNFACAEVKKPLKQNKEKPNVDLMFKHTTCSLNSGGEDITRNMDTCYLEVSIPLWMNELKSQINLEDYIVDIELTKKSK